MNKDKIIDKLTKIFDLELSGVIRYTHYSLMIFGPNRLPLIDFFKTQASESLLHANLAGEHITGLGGHPPLNINNIKETLKKGERVELRGFGVWSTHNQKARISRNPKTGEKVHTPQKKTIHFKMGKELFNKLNNEK